MLEREIQKKIGERVTVRLKRKVVLWKVDKDGNGKDVAYEPGTYPAVVAPNPVGSSQDPLLYWLVLEQDEDAVVGDSIGWFFGNSDVFVRAV